MNMMRSLRWPRLAALCGAALVAACEGENLFDSEQNPFLEPTVEVFAPDMAFAGDTVVVSLSASAALNVQRIAVSVRGAVSKDTIITTPVLRTASATVKLVMPAVLTSNSVVITAQAADVSGRVSRPASDTMAVVMPSPSIGASAMLDFVAQHRRVAFRFFRGASHRTVFEETLS